MRPIAVQTIKRDQDRGTRAPPAEYAAKTAPSASIEPTDRSIPPLMITKVMPTEMMRRKELATAMLAKFRALKNVLPNATAPATTTTKSTGMAGVRRR